MVALTENLLSKPVALQLSIVGGVDRPFMCNLFDLPSVVTLMALVVPTGGRVGMLMVALQLYCPSCEGSTDWKLKTLVDTGPVTTVSPSTEGSPVVMR